MSTISQNVMKKVSRVHTARMLTSRGALEAYALVVSLIALSVTVSVPHVVANMPAAGDFDLIIHFFVEAAFHTHLYVQILLAALLAICVSIAYDMARLRHHAASKRAITS